jgi:hypothetical protein
MGKLTYWPQMLLQFTNKHNMKVAYALEEHQHINQVFDDIDGTVTDELIVRSTMPAMPMYETIKYQSGHRPWFASGVATCLTTAHNMCCCRCTPECDNIQPAYTCRQELCCQWILCA